MCVLIISTILRTIHFLSDPFNYKPVSTREGSIRILITVRFARVMYSHMSLRDLE